MNIEIVIITLIIGGFIIVAIVSVSIISVCYKALNELLKNQIISKEDYKRINSLVNWYIYFLLPFILLDILPNKIYPFSFEPLISYILAPIRLTIAIIPVYIAILLFYRSYINPANKIEETGNIKSLDNSVKKIFDSNEFYSAIATVLPKGEYDKDYGLDYIPFMLQNLSEKRKRFQKSSRQFLTATISLSIFFIVVVISLSYILLNESSVGIYSEVKALSSEIVDFDKTISRLKLDISDDKYFSRTNQYNFDKLEKIDIFNLDDKEKPLFSTIRQTIENFEKDSDIIKLSRALKKTSDSLIILKSKNIEYIELLKSTQKSIDEYLRLRDKSLKEIELTQNNVKKILPQIQENLNKPINSQNELIKRLILSVVVVTFFLSILRYFRNLYQNHYNEMLKAENQDLLIRKFYVALKCFDSKLEERKIILSNFLSNPDINDNTNNNLNLKDKSKEGESNNIQNLLNTFLKKVIGDGK
jgi:hypothetical protein